MWIFQKAVVLGVLNHLLLGAVHCCDPDHIDQCEIQFADGLGVSVERLGEAFIPGSLNRTCSMYHVFENCIKTYTGYCQTQYIVKIEGLENIFNYICGEGFSTHQKYQPCLHDTPNLDSKVDLCNEQIYRDTDTFFINREEVCKIIIDAIDCVEKAVTEECGRDAAEHQIIIEKRYLQPFATEIHCEIDPVTTAPTMSQPAQSPAPGGMTNDKNKGIEIGGIIGGVISGILLLIIIAIVVIFLLFRHRVLKQANEQTQNTVNSSRPVSEPDVYEIPVSVAPPYSDPPPSYNSNVYDTVIFPVRSGRNVVEYQNLPGKW